MANPLKPRRSAKVSEFMLAATWAPPAQQKSRQEITNLPAAFLISECSGRQVEIVARLLSDKSAASPSRWSAASSADRQPAAAGMDNWLRVPVGDNQSESCQRPGCNRRLEDIRQDRNHQWHNHFGNHQTESKGLASNSHSGVKQHKYSPSIEQGVSWESFPQESGRDRIVDSRVAERIPPTVPGAGMRS